MTPWLGKQKTNYHYLHNAPNKVRFGFCFVSKKIIIISVTQFNCNFEIVMLMNNN